MKTKFFLSIIAIVMMASKVSAQEFVLKGTIGNYPVVMELDTDGEDLVGSYYYTSQGPTKRLGIHISYMGNGKWNMKENVDGDYNGTFSISIPTFRVGDKWTGTYINVQGKSFKYSLTMNKIARGVVTYRTGKVGNNPIVIEYYNGLSNGNYYYVSQGPQKRLALAYDGHRYEYDYLNGKQVGTFIYDGRTGCEYVNAQGKTFRVTFDN